MRQRDRRVSAAEWTLLVGQSASDPTSVSPPVAAAVLIVSHLPRVPLLRHPRLSAAVPRDTAAASVCWRSLNTHK